MRNPVPSISDLARRFRSRLYLNKSAKLAAIGAPSAGMRRSRTASRVDVWTRRAPRKSLAGELRRRFAKDCEKQLRGMKSSRKVRPRLEPEFVIEENVVATVW